MGIERFFSTLGRNFNIMTHNKENDYDEIINATHIYMDFNSVIHTISAKVLNPKMNFEELNLLIIKNIDKFIINFLKKFNLKKLKLLYIALDGVPTFAKIIEQKKRRYVGDLLNHLIKSKYPTSWSKNNISPGTIFMDQINDFLLNLNFNEDFQYIVSTSNENGEAEIKILDLINLLILDKNDKIIFFSPDSDVILLSMLSKNSNFINIIKHDSNKLLFTTININLLNNSIYEYCLKRITRINIKLEINKLINDIIFIFTIFGNDFLPKCESIQTNLDLLFLIDIYLINLINHTYILDKKIINNMILYNYFILLSNHERRLLFRNAFLNIYYNYNNINQINFIIDLYKLKNININKLVDGQIFGKPFYNFYNNILSYIDPFKLYITHEKYGVLYFYLIDKYKLFEIIKNYIISNNELPLNQLITINMNKNKFSSYENINLIKYNSTLPKHLTKLQTLDKEEKEEYLIENKLDKYYNIFNPINDFYKQSIKIKDIDSIYYYKKYFNNDLEKNIVKKYLEGLHWVCEYYFSRKKIDETWYYPYTRVPLFSSIIKYYTPHIILYNNKLNITSYEHLLYVTPVNINKLDQLYTLFPSHIIEKIIKFIKSHPNYFYDLDKIYKSNFNNLLDCSHSIFINKCDYKILEDVIDVKKFKL